MPLFVNRKSPPTLLWGAIPICVRRCPTFPPVWVVSSALAGLASGFGMGPGVSLPLWTAVTLFHSLSSVNLWVPRVFGGGVCINIIHCWNGVDCVWFVVWLRGFVVVVSFRPVSASSLRVLLRF